MLNPEIVYLRRVAMVVDAGEQARRCWDTIRNVVHSLYDMFTVFDRPELYLLGSDRRISVDDLDSFYDNPVIREYRGVRLIEPTLRVLMNTARSTQALVVVSTGEIFDLTDWINHPGLEQVWLVSVNPDTQHSAHPATTGTNATAELCSAPQAPLAIGSQVYPHWIWCRASAHTWHVDRSGFPMIWVPPLAGFVHIFPVMKMQFEQFLATNPDGFDDNWYSLRLATNSRVPIWQVTDTTYERLFITDIAANEARSFCRWLGERYTLLDQQDWRACCAWFVQQPVPSMPLTLYDAMSANARAAWQVIQRLVQPENLLDVSLMAQGILEWVTDRSRGRREAAYVLGAPRKQFFQGLRTTDRAETIPRERMWALGFRVQMKEA